MRHLPDKPWLAGWIAVLLLTTCLVGGTELFWRSRGCLPDVPDTPHLWSHWRSKIDRPDGRVLALLGTSRMKADVSTDELTRQFPQYTVAQLSVFGARSPIGTLEHLSRDESFRGLVICEMLPAFLERFRWADQRQFFEFESQPQQFWNALGSSWLQDQFVVLGPKYSLSSMLVRSSEGRSLPRADFKRQTFTRSLQYDFSRLSKSELLRAQSTDDYRAELAGFDVAAVAPGPAEFAAVNQMIGRIRQRGGNVIFVRLPSSGDRLALENELYPRAEWDRVAANVSATCIHFQDVAALRAFALPDGSHLDVADSAGFTRALVDELRQRKLLE